MLKRFFLPFILISLISCSLSFAQTAVRQDLNHIASITFPDKVEKKVSKVGTYYYNLTPTEHYFVQVRDISSDTTFTLKESELDTLYYGIEKGTLMAMNGGKMLYRGKRKFNNLSLAEAKYEFAPVVKGANKRVVYQNILFVNNTIFNISFWTTADSLKVTQDKKDAFFKSFRITTKAELKQYVESPDSGFQLNSLTGRYAIILLALFMLLGVTVYLNRRRFKRSQTLR